MKNGKRLGRWAKSKLKGTKEAIQRDYERRRVAAITGRARRKTMESEERHQYQLGYELGRKEQAFSRGLRQGTKPPLRERIVPSLVSFAERQTKKGGLFSNIDRDFYMGFGGSSSRRTPKKKKKGRKGKGRKIVIQH